MNNYTCPFCNHLLDKSIIQTWRGNGLTLDELSYSCEFQECKETSPRNVSRWYFERWSNSSINYYRAHLPYAGKNYILRGSSGIMWTRLYYDAADTGAMTIKPIIELPYIPLQEPLLEFLETNLRKAINYIIFT